MLHQIEICEVPLPNQTIKSIRYNKITKNVYDRDIIPGVYEGGYKLWQATIDLLKYIADPINQVDFSGKSVMDVGCGLGLLGIAALKLGAGSCQFQDYNKQVLETTTKQNLIINDLSFKNCSFLHGDWDSIKERQSKLDFILGAQLIYKQQNYDKIVHLCKKLLKPESGRAIFANKHYYFGVGGNMDDFKQCLQKNGLCFESCLKISPPKGGNKKQIISIRIEDSMKQ